MAGRKGNTTKPTPPATNAPKDANADAEMSSLDKETRDFLTNTEPPTGGGGGGGREKVQIENGKLYHFTITGYEANIDGNYGTYSRFDIDDNGTRKAFYLGSSADQKTLVRYIEQWLAEGYTFPMKVALVRYPRKSQKTNRTYFDIRADIESPKNTK